jgi:hypothetical protein
MVTGMCSVDSKTRVFGKVRLEIFGRGILVYTLVQG